MSDLRILVMSGSSRTGSWNRQLAAVAARQIAAQGAQVTELDLRELQLPLYDGDIEAAGLPAGALRLRDLVADHDGLLIASPEYNGFITPLLLNAFDWLSRVKAGDGRPDGLAAIGGKVAGLVSASPGGHGGMRALIFLRSFLSMNLAVHVVPPTHSVPVAHQAFDAQGGLVDEHHAAGVGRVVAALLRTARALQTRQG
jgi:chromate reductase